MSITSGIFFNKAYFGGDELILSQYLNLPDGVFPIVLGLIGLCVCFYTFLKLPIKSRFSFFGAGLFSGSVTYFLWFQYLGPVVLP